MFAVIETGSKQYKVKKGDEILIERLPKEKDAKISFDKVLLIADDKKAKIGQPYIKGASVEAKIVNNIKDDKVIVFKYKRKTGYRKKQGHRQLLAQVKIEKING